MTLNGLLTSLGQIAIHDRLVNWAGAGTSIYQVNDLTQRDYPCFFASPTGTHRVENAYTTYQLSLFYFDRLLEDSSNDIDIQSTAIEVLKNIIKKAAFVDGIVGVSDEYTITLFVETERFKDRCSGAYATIEITIVNDSECVIYSNDEPEPQPTPQGYFKFITPGHSDISSSATQEIVAWITDSEEIYYEFTGPDGLIMSGTTTGTSVNLQFPENTDSGSTKNYTFDAYDADGELLGTATWTQAAAEPEPPAPPVPEEINTSISIISGGTLTWSTGESDADKEIFISFDSGETWESVTSTSGGTEISVEAGDTLLLKGYNDSYGGATFSGSTAHFDIAGNIMSLINGDDFADLRSFPEGTTHNFFRLFAYTNVRNAGSLWLPVRNHTDSCYRDMFMSCRNLTFAPSVPCDNFAPHSCQWMFFDCKSYVSMRDGAFNVLQGKAAEECCEQMFAYSSVGEFDLQTIGSAQSSYAGMFRGTPIEHVALRFGYELEPYACHTMFSDCSELTEVYACNIITHNAQGCTDDWLRNVSANATIYLNAATDTWSRDASGVPAGWTIEECS